MSQRAWVDNDNDTDTYQVVALTNEALYQGEFDSAEHSQQAADSLQQGTAPATVFGSEATHIPLISIKKITIDQQDSDLDVDYTQGKEDENESISLSTEACRDEIYGALKAQAEGRFNEYEDNYNIPRSIWGGLMTFTIFGLFTWGLAAAAASIRAAEEVEVSGRRQGLKKLFVGILDLLGPTGVWVIGGLILLLCAFFVYARIKHPPRLLILQETPYKPGTVVGTSFKYLILFAIWYWAVGLFL